MTKRKENQSSKKKETIEAFEKKSHQLDQFDKEIVKPYLTGHEEEIESDPIAARALIPPATAAKRSFAFIGKEIPEFIPEKCTACMECVIECPDAAIHSRTVSEQELEDSLADLKDEDLKKQIRANFAKTVKHGKAFEKKGKKRGVFSISIDPDKCKSCGECVDVCDFSALRNIPKTPEVIESYRKQYNFIQDSMNNNPTYYINERLNVDMFMNETSRIYCGGAGSCMGCGETTAINMALTATAKEHKRNMVIVAATGCNTVYSSTYPYNVYQVPWTNSLFENAPAIAMGVRMRLDQQNKEDTKVWVIGGDGAMFDIGFQSLSRMLMSKMDINVLVLDTQAYSNTGGQASTATFHAQNAKMSAAGSAQAGKIEHRKELGILAMNHLDVFVAQVSAAYPNLFLKAVQDAISYPGPSLLIAYTACMPEHKIADHVAYDRAKAAVISRAFPLFVYDPRRSDTFADCLSLQGNPSMREDWVKNKEGEVHDFVWFAREEGRFAHLFDADGNPKPELLETQSNRLRYWHILQDYVGIRKQLYPGEKQNVAREQ